ncbi:MAG TPA: HAMP domain-containing sensor histidine kinase [Balneolaceae bacterium]|nr:HAMP domain-containing sensor histidine kinase [Balneolaceae bacterium]
MKLITKFIWIYLIVTVIVLGIAGYVSYFIIQEELNNELKWRFYGRIERVTYLLEQGKQFENGKIGESGHLVVMQLPDNIEPRVELRDTLVWNEWLQQMEPNLKMVAYRNVGNDSYYISTYGTLIETNDIREAVIQILLWILGMMVIGAIGVGFIISTRLFKPFRKTLARIKDFNLHSKKPIEAEKTNVKEFDDLNLFVEEMTRKAVSDYKNLKEFAENASHELQTPLAIAKGKLELLTETDLSPEQYQYVEASQRSIKQLSRLSKSLALLTKIENHEFSHADEVNFTRLIRESTQSFDEFIKLNGLDVHTDLEEDVVVNMHPVMADILWSNLFQNAIKHNIDEGSINIKLTDDYLNISNTGKPVNGEPALLFERFKKGDQNSHSIGLGLSIIKRIIDQNGYEISYHVVDGWHYLEVEF